MLQRSKRITKLAFKELLAHGAYGSSPHFSIRYLKSEKRISSTFSVVVSKKVANTAVLRNKIKRRCYHAIRNLGPKIKSQYTIALFVKKGIQNLSFVELSDAIGLLLAKNNLID